MRRTVSMLGAVAVLATTALGTSLDHSAATPAIKAKVSSGPGRWVQLSSGSRVGNTNDAAVHRFGSELQVVWTQGAGSDEALHTRILAADGAPVTADETLLTWQGVNQSPSITSYGKLRLIAFAGEQGQSGSSYNGGYGYYLTSVDGTRWTLATATLGSDPSVYDTTGEDVTDAGGTPVVVYPAVAASNVSYRRGFDSLPPAAGTRDKATTPSTTCCAYNAGVGYDATDHQTWTAWYSNSGKSSEGIDAERIYPTAGPQVHAPSSSSTFDRQPFQSIAPGQRVQVAERHGGGLYTAYGIGYPSQTKVALWKLGTSRPLVVNVGHGIAAPGVAAAPGGRLWLFWFVRGGTTLYATRTNKAATRLGKIRAIRTPHGSTTIWNTAGDGEDGPLDLVVDASVNYVLEYYSTQVLPGLSGRVSPSSVPSSRRSKITVTVTDAGDAVSGAAVHYNRSTKRTNSHGTATFTVAKGASRGRHAITFSHSGYAGGTLHLHVI